MRIPNFCSASIFFALVGCLSVGAVRAAQEDAPNILLIVADDLGFSDLGCYGGEIETPNLDRLANGGLRLTQFYTTGRCCPSRAGLLTGLYPHSVGLGHMTQDIGQPGYRGRLADGVMTIGDQLSRAGYRAFLSGKWHLGTDDPTRHGFEEFYGTLTSAKTFWDPQHYRRLPQGRQPRGYDEATFYGTDALADHAIDFLGQARQTPEKPWFLYLAFNAPHFPLQARPETIAKYAGHYSMGWDVAREQRLARMKRLGVIPPTTLLTPRSPYYDWAAVESAPNPSWDSLPKDRQADLARRMAIYAAMVDSMDQNIGRILSDLEGRGELQNTLIVFTSDNGACAEWDMYGFDGKSGPNNHLHHGEEIETMGSRGTFHSAGSGWANASNTPWRLYKHYNHEGGIAVPCIIHWPARTRADRSLRGGHINATPTHLIDILPTFLDAAGWPSTKRAASSLQGKSLLPLIANEAIEQRELFFEHEGNRAVRSGRWKLVALRGQNWELYDMDSDRTELSDLASRRPNLVKRLATSWNAWATDNHVTPLPGDYHVPYVPVGEEARRRAD